MNHPVITASQRELADYDDNRELHERRNRIHHLTRIGMSEEEIAVVVGISGRTVARHRMKPVEPQRPRLYDGASVSEERAEQLDQTADLALHLAAILRDEDPTIVWGSLIRLDERQLRELAVVALAAIPVEMTKDELLSWVRQLDRTSE